MARLPANGLRGRVVRRGEASVKPRHATMRARMSGVFSTVHFSRSLFGLSSLL